METTRRSFFGLLTGLLSLPLLARAENVQTTVPTEPGWYWFTGVRLLTDTRNEKIDRPIEIRQSLQGGLYAEWYGWGLQHRLHEFEGTWTKIQKP